MLRSFTKAASRPVALQRVMVSGVRYNSTEADSSSQQIIDTIRKDSAVQNQRQQKKGLRSNEVLKSTMQMVQNLSESAEDQKFDITDKFFPSLPVKSRYDPFDFSIAAMNLAKKNKQYTVVGNRKLENKKLQRLYVKPALASEYMTSGGNVLSREATGLSQKQQAFLSKAIRRARAWGLLSRVHKDMSDVYLPDRKRDLPPLNYRM